MYFLLILKFVLRTPHNWKVKRSTKCDKLDNRYPKDVDSYKMPQRINSELFVRPKSALVRDQPVLLMVLGAQAVWWCALHRIAWKWLIDHAATLLGLAGNMRPIPSLSSISFQFLISENYLKLSWQNTHLHILDPASMSIYASIARYWYFRLQHPCLSWRALPG